MQNTPTLISPAQEIKVYSIADLERKTTQNSWERVMYKERGLTLTLQGNYDQQRQRAQGRSPIHHHETFDEIIYLLEGDYGNHNRINVSQPFRSLLRIPAGIGHGGDSNGVWISVKPEGFQFSRGDGLKFEYSADASRLLITYLASQDDSFHVPPSELEIILEISPQLVKLIEDDKTQSQKSRADLISFEFIEL